MGVGLSIEVSATGPAAACSRDARGVTRIAVGVPSGPFRRRSAARGRRPGRRRQPRQTLGAGHRHAVHLRAPRLPARQLPVRHHARRATAGGRGLADDRVRVGDLRRGLPARWQLRAGRACRGGARSARGVPGAAEGRRHRLRPRHLLARLPFRSGLGGGDQRHRDHARRADRARRRAPGHHAAPRRPPRPRPRRSRPAPTSRRICSPSHSLARSPTGAS
jgi:hypothetical protein